VAVVILALGVAANTAIFTVVDAVLLRPLPISNPGSVVVIHNQLPSLNLPRTEVSAPQFLDYSRDADVFESTGALTTQNFKVVLIIAASAAGFVPAWRAVRTDPMIALRRQ
jgi:hypothetical protein